LFEFGNNERVIETSLKIIIGSFCSFFNSYIHFFLAEEIIFAAFGWFMFDV